MRSLLLVFISLSIPLLANGQAETKLEPIASMNEEQKSIDIAKISQAFGHLLGKNIEELGVKLDLAAVIQGLEDAQKGTPPPLNERQCLEAINQLQDIALKEEAEINLRETEKFLENNSSQPEVVSLEKGKLQYKVLAEGAGKKLTGEDSMVLVKYKGKFIDGDVFTETNNPELLDLSSTIDGFRSGIMGMKEGERRELYIHPDLAYGTSGELPPNALLNFEVELVGIKAKETAEVKNESGISADPVEQREVLR